MELKEILDYAMRKGTFLYFHYFYHLSSIVQKNISSRIATGTFINGDGYSLFYHINVCSNDCLCIAFCSFILLCYNSLPYNVATFNFLTYMVNFEKSIKKFVSILHYQCLLIFIIY